MLEATFGWLVSLTRLATSSASLKIHTFRLKTPSHNFMILDGDSEFWRPPPPTARARLTAPTLPFCRPNSAASPQSVLRCGDGKPSRFQTLLFALQPSYNAVAP